MAIKICSVFVFVLGENGEAISNSDLTSEITFCRCKTSDAGFAEPGVEMFLFTLQYHSENRKVSNVIDASHYSLP